MKFNEAELTRIRNNDGKHCENCFRLMAIDTYGITPVMNRVLRLMADATTKQLKEARKKGRAIDVDALALKNSERSQLTKMRFHGLVTKHIVDDRHVARHWLVTAKGYAYLRGHEVPAKVEVYHNTVIGHVGGTTNIDEVERAQKPADSPAVMSREHIAQPEAAAFAFVREPKKHQQITAELIRPNFGTYNKGDLVNILIDGLQFGKPVRMLEPYEHEYKDISAFRADWKIAA